ncbi:F0F1 ATP synthase subunit A [Clostridium sp.]|jgi:F-type H+-transporting ATPase subunit a|uniref:F0F1 ATP synthase subunit A n=1 Tax=Clostridium sp. TaxID=1506 RepID=UPI0039F471BB
MEEKRRIILSLLGYKFSISEAVIIQWVIVLIFLIFCIIVKNILKGTPDKKQSIVEMIVEGINNLVISTMGEGAAVFVPYIGTLVIFLLLMNISGLFGVEPPTTDFSVTSGVAAISFVVIQAYAIKKHGLKSYFMGYARPTWVLLPINIMERIMLPVSLSLRLFGNITAASIIIELVYSGLAKTPLGIGQLAIPAPLHFYFDIFDGGLQMLIFAMLTMINIKTVSEH